MSNIIGYYVKGIAKTGDIPQQVHSHCIERGKELGQIKNEQITSPILSNGKDNICGFCDREFREHPKIVKKFTGYIVKKPGREGYYEEGNNYFFHLHCLPTKAEIDRAQIAKAWGGSFDDECDICSVDRSFKKKADLLAYMRRYEGKPLQLSRYHKKQSMRLSQHDRRILEDLLDLHLGNTLSLMLDRHRDNSHEEISKMFKDSVYLN